MSELAGETAGRQRFREKLEVLARQRERRLAEGTLSLPPEQGVLAITVSGASSGTRRSIPETMYASFMEEAERLKETRERSGRYAGVVIRPRAVVEQLQSDFANPEIAALALIGNGSIGRLWTDSGRREFDYLAATTAATHLKQGTVEQRMCAHFPRSIYSVPLGTFTVSRLSDLTAAMEAGIGVPDRALSIEEDRMFVPVYDDSRDLLTQIDEFNAAGGLQLAGREAA